MGPNRRIYRVGDCSICINFCSEYSVCLNDDIISETVPIICYLSTGSARGKEFQSIDLIAYYVAHLFPTLFHLHCTSSQSQVVRASFLLGVALEVHPMPSQMISPRSHKPPLAGSALKIPVLQSEGRSAPSGLLSVERCWRRNIPE